MFRVEFECQGLRTLGWHHFWFRKWSALMSSMWHREKRKNQKQNRGNNKAFRTTSTRWPFLTFASGPVSTVTLGGRNATGDDGREFPPTRVTTPLQSTALRLIPLGGNRRCDKKLHWLILLLRRSNLRGRNKEPLWLRSSSKILLSSSANSFSEPTSCAWLRKLKTLVLLFRLGEKRGPRKLRKDWERRIFFSGHMIHVKKKEWRRWCLQKKRFLRWRKKR